MSAKATSKTPKYIQLGDDIKSQIERGLLKAGDRLPTFVEMRAQHGVMPATVEHAYARLEQEGLIVRERGRGTFVTEPQRALTGNIGFIGSAGYNTPTTPFYQQLMGAMHQRVGCDRQHLLYLGADKSWDSSAFSKVDGVLICNIEDPSALLQELPANLPRVSVLTIVDGVTSVGVDDYRGAQMAVKHLLEAGHRRIACLMEKFPSEAHRRFAGYRDAMMEAGIEPEASWIKQTGSVRADKGKWKTAQPYREWARLHMRAWLQEGWTATGCTAILVQNEVAAIGALQILQEEGIKVPQQVSIMTFDGTDLCDLVSPHLSAVALPLEQIGETAIEVLNRQVAGEPASAQAIMLPLRLREGESVAPAPEAAAAPSKELLECR